MDTLKYIEETSIDKKISIDQKIAAISDFFWNNGQKNFARFLRKFEGCSFSQYEQFKKNLAQLEKIKI